MASGILQYTLGHCYVPQLCDTTHTTLPPSAVRYYEARHKIGVWLAKYRTSKHGKRVRAAARASMKQLVQTTAVIEAQSENTYVGKGGCLIPHFITDEPEAIPAKKQRKNKRN